MTKNAQEAASPSIPDAVPLAHSEELRTGQSSCRVKRRQGRSALLCVISVALMLSTLADLRTAFSQGTSAEAQARKHPKGMQNDWNSYHGDITGRRYSELEEITPGNVHRLELKWVFHSRNVRVLGAAPVVVSGVMYLSASNDLFAIDGRTGDVLWHDTRQDAIERDDDESAQINRGIAFSSDRLYMETNDGHLLCMDARSGNLFWDVAFAEGQIGYGGVSAPLAIPGKVIIGAPGRNGDQGAFVAAFDANDGKELWRYTLALGGPHRRSSQASAESWTTGTYDSDMNLIFEESDSATCAAQPDAKIEVESGGENEVQQGGCLLALDANAGKLKWQFPLPDEEPRTAVISAVPMLIDAPLQSPGSEQGSYRKLIVAAQGNGYITVLDRSKGMLVTQRRMNPTSSAWENKRVHPPGPVLSPPRRDEAIPCIDEKSSPSWNPPAYNEQTQRFYFLAFESCRDNVEAPRAVKGAQSQSHLIGESSLLAYDPGRDTWTWLDDPAAVSHVPSGITTTATGLLLSGGISQSVQIVKALTGEVLWSFPLGQSPTGPPITYSVSGKQYFSIAAGNDLFVFGLKCLAPCKPE